jgi:hypothetical protein
MPETRCRELLAIFLDFFHLFSHGQENDVKLLHVCDSALG